MPTGEDGSTIEGGPTTAGSSSLPDYKDRIPDINIAQQLAQKENELRTLEHQLLPKEETLVPEQPVGDPSSVISAENPTIPADTTQVEQQSLVDADGKEINLEKIRGGNFEVLKPLVEKFPEIFKVKTDSEGRTIVMTDFIDGVVDPENVKARIFVPGIDTRALVFWQDRIARVTSSEPISEDLKGILSSVSPEALTQWHQALVARRSNIGQIFSIKSKDLGLQIGAGNTYANVHLQDLNVRSLIKNFVKEPLKELVREKNEKMVETLREELEGLV